jgi:hypothetical protein
MKVAPLSCLAPTCTSLLHRPGQDRERCLEETARTLRASANEDKALVMWPPLAHAFTGTRPCDEQSATISSDVRVFVLAFVIDDISGNMRPSKRSWDRGAWLRRR